MILPLREIILLGAGLGMGIVVSIWWMGLSSPFRSNHSPVDLVGHDVKRLTGRKLRGR